MNKNYHQYTECTHVSSEEIPVASHPIEPRSKSKKGTHLSQTLLIWDKEEGEWKVSWNNEHEFT